MQLTYLTTRIILPLLYAIAILSLIFWLPILFIHSCVIDSMYSTWYTSFYVYMVSSFMEICLLQLIVRKSSVPATKCHQKQLIHL